MKKRLRIFPLLLLFSLLLLAGGAWDHADIRPTVYPNPASDYISLSNNEEVRRLVLYNLTGREVIAFNTASGERYNISQLPTGLYLVQFLNAEKRVLHTQRLQKR